MSKRVPSGKTGAGNKRGRVLSMAILIAAVLIILFSLSKLIPILLDYRQSAQTYQDLAEQYVEVPADAGTGDADRDPADADEQSGQGYDWAAVSIDFEALKQINPDVVGWIRFDDTAAVAVDYPILYAGDNDTYLRTDLYGASHTSGSIFLEAADTPDFSDCYNIIYGHNMRNGTMFGTLKKYRREEDFYDANPYFTIYTEDAAYRYQIFAYEVVPDDSEIYTAGYEPDEAYRDLIDLMCSLSARDTGIVPEVTDRIVTLSTCTSVNDDERFVLHAVCVDQRDYG
ncbi:MAG: class B sortase [Lachnospiraceae bacterium]|nr:class B sortase [Lachnospiraceae bacterium]